MTALLAIFLGFAAVGYAAWPWLVRGGTARPLREAASDVDPPLESQLAALRAWSVAAGELPADTSNAEVKNSE